jgi:UDP-N-acetylmuramoyl-tripeptide--D-alanyl-D-alanine ligase
MQVLQLYELYQQSLSVQTDTRKLKAGDLFFALKGEHFNGNLFAKEALDKGAIAVVVDEATGIDDARIFKVENVLTTLQQLAKHHRLQFDTLSTGRQVPFIAITGSNGKTTTKELIHAVLSTHFKTSTTEGNLNNHIGIPLTILKVPQDAEIAVIEMGANHQKEIASYCLYTLPTHGLINNVGKAHLEGFGGIEGVKKGKGELYDFIRESGGIIFMNNDFEYLREMSRGIEHKLTYGTHDAQTTGIIKNSDPFLTVEITSNEEMGIIATHLVGDYNLPNVLAAVAVGQYFGVPPHKIKSAIEAYQPSNSRSQMVERNTNHIILDAYNANPSSMKLAIENFAKLKADKKVVMLGAMAELGDESITEHRAIVDLLKLHSWQQVVLVGGDFLKVDHPFLSFDNSDKAKEWFEQHAFKNTHFLIKGSRSMKMEKIAETSKAV